MAKEKTNTEQETTNTETSTKEEGIELEGVVTDALRDGKFRVKVAGKDPSSPPHIVIAHLGGKLRKNFIKIVVGDSVKVEVSMYDLNKGRITFRNKN